MQISKLIAPDMQKALEGDPEALAEALQELHVEDLADLVAELPSSLVAQLMQVLPTDLAADVLSRLPGGIGTTALESMTPQRAANVLTEVAPDDVADLVQELHEDAREEILDHMEKREPELAEEVRNLAAYGPSTAGGIMTPGYLAVRPELTVAQAIDFVRRRAREEDVELISPVYVVAYDKLVGVLSLRDLIVSDDHRLVSDTMTSQMVRVLPSEDQEDVAKTMAKYDLTAIPVVDESGSMLGVVTIDDVVDVMVEEATEDAHKMGAVVPTEMPYFQSSFLAVVRSRASWLVVLFLGELLTFNVMHVYEAQMAAVIDLVLFIPLIISSGGNSGSQSSSLVIRALALGELFPRDWRRVVQRELFVGLALGGLLGLLGFARAFSGSVSGATAISPWGIAITVAISVLSVVTLGTLVGSVMPLAMRRAGLDPAVASTPFVASLVDVLGLIVYFTVARVVLATVL